MFKIIVLKGEGIMEYKIKPFEELDVIDDYMANAAASDPVVGKAFARALVEGLLQKELGEHVRVNVQRSVLGDTPEKRGIRMDLEVAEFDENSLDAMPVNIYDVEPNKRKDIDILKHNRFYQAKIDSQGLKSGEKDFVRLPNLFVIMITNYDPFGYDYMLYTVINMCEEVPELKYEDGLCYLYFNTSGTNGGNEALKSFLSYIQNSTPVNVKDDATKRIHQYVSVVKESPEERKKYMLWEEKIFYERRDAKDEERLRMIKKKLEKNKSVEQIAEEIEITVEEVVEYICMISE